MVRIVVDLQIGIASRPIYPIDLDEAKACAPNREIKQMVKISFCLRRRTGLSHEEFQDYWQNDHGALVQQYKAVLRISRYIQFHGDFGTMTSKLIAFRGSPEPYDGIAEIWYESRSALETLGQDPAARAASRLLWEDEKRFVDLENSPIFAGEEITLIGTP